MLAHHDATEPAPCRGDHGPDECHICMPAWLEAERAEFEDRQAFAESWGGR